MMTLGIRRRYLLADQIGQLCQQFPIAPGEKAPTPSLPSSPRPMGDFNWRLIRSVRYTQGFISSDPARSVSVRIDERGASLVIGCIPEGLMNPRHEYPIPVAEAHQMLTQCDGPRLDRLSRRFCYGKDFWRIDEYLGDNNGLVMAEVELSAVDEPFTPPHWVGEEVTGDPAYTPEQLLAQPYISRRHSLLESTPLQPCPHCGASAGVELTNTYKENLLNQTNWVFHLVRCQMGALRGGCGSQGPWSDTAEEAVHGWNRRVNLRALALSQFQGMLSAAQGYQSNAKADGQAQPAEGGGAGGPGSAGGARGNQGELFSAGNPASTDLNKADGAGQVTGGSPD